MSHMPKRAQRAIDKANQSRDARLSEQYKHRMALPVPRMMSLNLTPRNIINMYDIFFNGEKQHLCIYADVNKGMIRRWSHGKGNRPDKDAFREDCYGTVEIRLKAR
jgi:hypothetical protein